MQDDESLATRHSPILFHFCPSENDGGQWAYACKLRTTITLNFSQSRGRPLYRPFGSGKDAGTLGSTAPQIPIAYTQGFNKRARMQLAAALPLGYLSKCELADIYLTERLEPATAQEQMMQKDGPGH
ncbi:MAG: DUF2344 domain-containing protein [Chloroflexi bacterium]|nr:DUF2344 domain-containing protein [Chloroflexota bacterium]